MTYKLMFNDRHARGEINPAVALYRYWDAILTGSGVNHCTWGVRGQGYLSRAQEERSKAHAGRWEIPPGTIQFHPLIIKPNGDFAFYRPFADRGRNNLRDHSFLNWGHTASKWHWLVDLTTDSNYGYGTHLSSQPYVYQDILTSRYYRYSGRATHWMRLVWDREWNKTGAWTITAAPGQPEFAADIARDNAIRNRRENPTHRNVSVPAGRVRVNGQQMTLDEAVPFVAVHFDLSAPAKRFSTQRPHRRLTDGNDNVAAALRSVSQ